MPQLELIFGTSDAARTLLGEIEAFAATPWPVLMLGPSGSGKTVLARYIHDRSPRRTGPFVNCPLPAIPEELRHAHLLGFRRGAFTGALEDRAGSMESAHRGSLFLDELGHASLGVQQLLLAALESSSVQRIGEVRERPIDVRFLFATATDVAERARDGQFLQELYWRVAGLAIKVPSLAERRSDIIALAARFLAAELAVLGKPFRAALSAAAADCLRNAPWPGNIRQLRSVCRHIAALLDRERPIDLTDVPQVLLSDGTDRLASTKRNSVWTALDRAGGNKSKAARMLAVSRPAFYRLLAESRPPRIPEAVEALNLVPGRRVVND